MELLERMFAASASTQLENNRPATAIWKLEIFWWQAQLEGDRLQLQSGKFRFLGAGLVGRRQGYNCNLGTRDFLVVGPVGRRQGYNCNLGTRDFWGQAQLEGDRATTAIWEIEIFGGRPSWKATRLQLQSGNSRFFGGRPSWKATGLQLQSRNSRFLGAGPVGRRQGYNCDLGTRDFLVVGSVGRRQGYNCNLGTRDFWGQAQLEGDKATTAIWDLEIFLVAGPGGRRWLVVRRQGYNDKYRGLVTVDFILSDFSAANPVTTAIWELEIFWW